MTASRVWSGGDGSPRACEPRLRANGAANLRTRQTACSLLCYAESARTARLLKTLLSNCPFDRGQKAVRPVRERTETGDWLTSLDNFRNWLIREAA